MTATVAGIHLGPDTHANRPAAGTPPVGSLYSCSTHSLVYRTDGSTWVTWATLGGSAVTDATISVSDVTTNNVSSSAHGWAPKGDGTTTKFLNANGAYSTPAGGSATFSGCLAYNSTTQVLGGAGELTFDSEDFDTDAYHSTVTNTGRLTIPSALDGKFLAYAHVYRSTSSATDLYIWKNGAVCRGGYLTINTVSAVVTVMLDLVATDYLQVHLASAGTYGNAADVSLQCTFGLMRLG
jgi:hypothetical protein